MQPSDRPRVVAVVGPTATGKSDLALDLAEALDGEVVNADSMQLYAGMDIGTAKLSVAERRGVPHHLLDVWPVTQTATVADYQQLARTVIDGLLAAGTTPVLVGGSGLYLRAVLDELEFPGTDPQVRARLEGELTAYGEGLLRKRLVTADPAAAASIPRGNGRRVVRALEVIEITGRPYSATLPSYDRPHYDAVHLGLDRETTALDLRVDERVERMWAAGLVEEVRGLLPLGLRDGVTASRALGYAQVLSLLDGVVDEPFAKLQTKLLTRRFVRKQRSWFRRDPRITWLDPDEPELAQKCLGMVISGSTG